MRARVRVRVMTGLRLTMLDGAAEIFGPLRIRGLDHKELER